MQHFPVYLDYAATTPPDPAVSELMLRCLTETFHNPSSSYSASGPARRQMRLARKSLGEVLSCRPEELVFTSGGTEANALALWQAAGQHVVLSAIEHPSVLENAKLFGCKLTLVSPDKNGMITPSAIEVALRPDTFLVSVQYANNETGVLHPVSQIGSMLKGRNILFHCDAVQAAGHIPVNLEESGVDLVSLSAHKLYGPRGVGCLYVRRGTKLRPLIDGGGQEKGMRSGTENVPAIAGFGLAAELAHKDLLQRGERETNLRLELEKELHALFPACGILGENARRLPGITAVRFPKMPSEWLLSRLDLMGIQLSGGAACASRSGEASHVYRASGLTDDEAKEVVRISIGRHTNREDIEYLLHCLQQLLTAQ